LASSTSTNSAWLARSSVNPMTSSPGAARVTPAPTSATERLDLIRVVVGNEQFR
jgi:hypothetical protein